MDKLARLMPGLPQYLYPQRLAETGERITGQLQLRDMGRLGALLQDDSGAVTFHLDFGKSDQGSVRIAGSYSTSLCVLCQRCLEPLQLHLERPIEVAVEEGGELVLEDGRLHLAGFIEDEILLGLPIAPAHEQGQCRVLNEAADGGREARQNPFAALKNLKIGND